MPFGTADLLPATPGRVKVIIRNSVIKKHRIYRNIFIILHSQNNPAQIIYIAAISVYHVIDIVC